MFDATWYAFVIPACGVMIVGALAGLLGTFAFLQKQTMLGDAVAHAALPGIVGIFMVTHTATTGLLIVGGLIAGLFAVALINLFSRYTYLGSDALLGIVLSVFFGIGLVLLTAVQKEPISSQSVLNKFLFGSAATLLYADLQLLCALACGVVLCIFLCWRQLVMVVFDPNHARVVGLPVTALQMMLSFLLVTVIVAGLYAVGVVLMSSLLVAPAVTARALTRSVWGMAFCSAICGASAAFIGMSCSALVPHMPTGPAIVVVATLYALAALGIQRLRRGSV